jgi:hypothetical protein
MPAHPDNNKMIPKVTNFFNIQIFNSALIRSQNLKASYDDVLHDIFL